MTAPSHVFLFQEDSRQSLSQGSGAAGLVCDGYCEGYRP